MRYVFVAVCILLAGTGAVSAQVAPTTTITAVDLHPAVQYLIAFAATLIPVIFAWIGLMAKKYLNIQAGSAAATLIDMATKRAGGLAYDFLAKEADGVPHSIDMRTAAIATGVNHLVASIPTALNDAGVTPETLARMVAAELGRLEAADPNVSIGPVASPAPVLVPAVPVAVVPAPPAPPEPATSVTPPSPAPV